jgi:hypothetical protein
MWSKTTGKNVVGTGRAVIAPLPIGVSKARVPVVLNTALTAVEGVRPAAWTSVTPISRRD